MKKIPQWIRAYMLRAGWVRVDDRQLTTDIRNSFYRQLGRQLDNVLGNVTMLGKHVDTLTHDSLAVVSVCKVLVNDCRQWVMNSFGVEALKEFDKLIEDGVTKCMKAVENGQFDIRAATKDITAHTKNLKDLNKTLEDM